MLKVDLHQLIAEEFAGMEVAVCANLPYYITYAILMYLLEEKLPIRSITVMVQKEAAAGLTAEPGTREVGAISIALRYYCTPSVLFQVSRGESMPAPDVDSTVIRLDLLPEPAVRVRDEALFFQTVKAPSQRRKTLPNCERLLPPSQGRSDCPAGSRRNPGHRPGRAAFDGAVRRPVRSPV